MSKVFYRKKFSDYLGEQRAIDDIVQFFTSDIPPTPSPTPGMLTPTPTPSVTATLTPTPSVTATVTATPSVTPTGTPSVTTTPTNTASPTPTATQTGTPNVTATPTSTLTPTPSVTQTGTPAVTPTPSVTRTATVTPTNTGSPTPTPTLTPSSTPPPDILCALKAEDGNYILAEDGNELISNGAGCERSVVYQSSYGYGIPNTVFSDGMSFGNGYAVVTISAVGTVGVTPLSTTLNGTAMNLLSVSTLNGVISAIYGLTYTGGSATVISTFSGTINKIFRTNLTCYNLISTTPKGNIQTTSTTDVATGNYPSVTLDDIIISTNASNNASFGNSWTNNTQVFYISVVGLSASAAANVTPLSGSVNITSTLFGTPPTAHTMVSVLLN
jgi:hypothetical protein